MEKNDVFIGGAKIIHNNKYDYKYTSYVNNKLNVMIMCPEHGIFKTTPERHLIGIGCSICSGYRLNTIEFIKRANIIHGDKYIYDNVNYINNRIKLNIICRKHGGFNQTSTMHLKGQGCPKCANELNSDNRKMKLNDFIERAKITHNDKYDYNEVKYQHSQINVEIICSAHGVFKQKPNKHLLGHGCPKCANIKNNLSKRKTTEGFINEAKLIHGNKYDYSRVKYVGSINKVCIVCLKHGKFEQQPTNHLMGNGCPICSESKGENKIRKILNEKNIKHIQQKVFDDCRGKSRRLPFDFYLDDLNVLIEYNGEQHYQPIKYFGGSRTFKRISDSDIIKENYAKNNGIKLIKIKYCDFDDIENILTNEKIIN